MPRLNRVLTQAKNVKTQHATSGLQLPKPANLKSLEESKALTCQYTILKLLYERAFPAWLEKRGKKELGKWIENACQRADTAAQTINKDNFAEARTKALKYFETVPTVAADSGIL